MPRVRVRNRRSPRNNTPNNVNTTTNLKNDMEEIIVEEQAEEEPERKLSDDDDDDNSDTLIDNITKNGVEEEDDVEETITNNNADNEDIGLDEAIEQFAMSLSRIGDQLLCPICRSLYKNAARLPCGHAFCRQCIVTCIGYQPKCPECRAPATKRNVSDYECMQRIVRNFQKLHHNSNTNGNNTGEGSYSPSMLTQPETASQLVAAFRGGLDEYLDDENEKMDENDENNNEDEVDDILERLNKTANSPMLSQDSSQLFNQDEEDEVDNIINGNIVSKNNNSNQENVINNDDTNNNSNVTEEVNNNNKQMIQIVEQVGVVDVEEDATSIVTTTTTTTSTTTTTTTATTTNDDDNTPIENNNKDNNENDTKVIEEFDGPLHVGDCVNIKADWSPGNTLDGGQGIVMDIENDELYTIRLILSKRTQKVTRRRIVEKINDIHSAGRPKRARRQRSTYEPLIQTSPRFFRVDQKRSSSKKKKRKRTEKATSKASNGSKTNKNSSSNSSKKKKKSPANILSDEKDDEKTNNNNDNTKDDIDNTTITNRDEKKKKKSSLSAKKKGKKRPRRSVKFNLPDDVDGENENYVNGSTPVSSNNSSSSSSSRNSDGKKSSKKNKKRPLNRTSSILKIGKAKNKKKNVSKTKISTATSVVTSASTVSNKKAPNSSSSSAVMSSNSKTNNDFVLMFVGSGTKDLVKVARTLCKSFGGRINTTLNQCDKYPATHVIVRSDGGDENDKLLMYVKNRKTNLSKLYHGILMGAWIVNDEWLLNCEKNEEWVDEEPFEIQGDKNAAIHIAGGPKRGRLARNSSGSNGSLFHDLTFFICGGTKNEPVKQHELELLLRLGDGRVFPMDRLSDKSNGEKNCFLLVRGNKEFIPELALELVQGKKLTVLKMQWVYDSISNYQLVENVDYVIKNGDIENNDGGSSSRTRFSSRKNSNSTNMFALGSSSGSVGRRRSSRKQRSQY